MSGDDFSSKPKSGNQFLQCVCYVQGKARLISGGLSSSDFGEMGRIPPPPPTKRPPPDHKAINLNDSALLTLQ